MTEIAAKHTDGINTLAELAATHAVTTDRDGAFPQAVIDAFLNSPLAGLMNGPDASLRTASAVVAALGEQCGSSAMIVAMHYSGACVIEALGSDEAKAQLSTGGKLTTLAFSEAGSRSHFWAPVSTASAAGDQVVLNARKSWITSANHAHSYVWSSGAVGGQGTSIWLVPRETAGIAPSAQFDGMGLRGNDSAPVSAHEARIPAANLLGEDGKGADVMLGTVLPVFTVLNASASLGLMRGACARTIDHASATRFEHLDQSIARFPTARAFIARMQLRTDMVAALIGDTISAIESPGPATSLRVLEVKAAAGEAATEVTDLAMRVCGGAAFRREVGVERLFRDARAATVMAPTSDQLHDFIGRALCGLDLFD